MSELEHYDAGIINDFGGGNVSWWQDYIRNELEKCREHYQFQHEAEISRLESELEQARAENASLKAQREIDLAQAKKALLDVMDQVKRIIKAKEQAEAELENEHKLSSRLNQRCEELTERAANYEMDAKRWCDISGELAKEKEAEREKLKDGFNKLGDAYDSLKARHCLICLDKCLHMKSEIAEALASAPDGRGINE